MYNGLKSLILPLTKLKLFSRVELALFLHLISLGTISTSNVFIAVDRIHYEYKQWLALTTIPPRKEPKLL